MVRATIGIDNRPHYVIKTSRAVSCTHLSVRRVRTVSSSRESAGRCNAVYLWKSNDYAANYRYRERISKSMICGV